MIHLWEWIQLLFHPQVELKHQQVSAQRQIVANMNALRKCNYNLALPLFILVEKRYSALGPNFLFFGEGIYLVGLFLF